MAQYIAALDQGTTSTRFMTFNHDGKIVANAQQEHQQIYPKPGWVEHNPLEIWQSTCEVINEALRNNKIKVNDIIAVGVTNQRETTVLWDKDTGKPVYNAIVWQDTRTDAICNNLAMIGGLNRLRKGWITTGNIFFGPQNQMDLR